MRARNGEALATFERLVNIESDNCTIWPHSLSSSGYGQLGANGTIRNVHVMACERLHGPRPTGMQAAHSCGTDRRCMNPRHLRWATPAENAADKVEQGTAQRGANAGNVKLTEADVHEIRHAKNAGVRSVVLADRYQVSVRQIDDIAARRRWAWLPDVDADLIELPTAATDTPAARAS